MSKYIENPKTKGSGICCCIPQTGECPNHCEDCFFQSKRSYLEPLSENLPNMPSLEEVGDRIVRVNDGNDSNVRRDNVIIATAQYKQKFFNTAIAEHLLDFPAPVVLTLNPGAMTDSSFHVLVDPIPNNLMFVRFRSNTWNRTLCGKAVEYYTSRKVPVVLTFMAYHVNPRDRFTPGCDRFTAENSYIYRKRTLNSYWAISTSAWLTTMEMFKFNNLVYSCGHIEGECGNTGCKYCGNCLREYYSTIQRISEGGKR